MTQEKMRKVIAACVSAATVLLMLLFGYLIYQWRTISILDKRYEQIKAEIVYWEERVAAAENDLEYYQSKFYLDQKVLEWQLAQENNK